MAYDFNELESTAIALKDAGRHRDALRIYLYMADGDPSLDGGYLGAESETVTSGSANLMPLVTGTLER